MTFVQLRNIVCRRAAGVNSISAIAWDIGCPDIDSHIIPWQDDEVGPLGSDSHFVASSTMRISLSVRAYSS